MKWLFILLALIVVCGPAWASGRADFARYQVIITRQPFGSPPVEPAPPPPPPSRMADSFISHISLCGITRHPVFGLRVAFVDRAGKRFGYLRVGEEQNGIRVVEADFARGSALLRKGEEAYWLNLAGQVTAAPSSGP